MATSIPQPPDEAVQQFLVLNYQSGDKAPVAMPALLYT
jgi:hypothetical protein